MPAVAPELVYGTGTHWAFGARHTFDNADNYAWVNGNIAGIQEYGDVVVVDGVSVYPGNLSIADEVVNTTVYSTTRGGASVSHIVGRFTVPAGTVLANFYHPLGIPSALTASRFVEIFVDDAVALDNVYFTAWGHYLPTQQPIEPTPVSVQEFHLFKPRKVSGPV